MGKWQHLHKIATFDETFWTPPLLLDRNGSLLKLDPTGILHRGAWSESSLQLHSEAAPTASCTDAQQGMVDDGGMVNGQVQRNIKEPNAWRFTDWHHATISLKVENKQKASKNPWFLACVTHWWSSETAQLDVLEASSIPQSSQVKAHALFQAMEHHCRVGQLLGLNQGARNHLVLWSSIMIAYYNILQHSMT